MFHANVELKLFCEICNFEDFLLLPNMKISHIDRDHRQEWSFITSNTICFGWFVCERNFVVVSIVSTPLFIMIFLIFMIFPVFQLKGGLKIVLLVFVWSNEWPFLPMIPINMTNFHIWQQQKIFKITYFTEKFFSWKTGKIIKIRNIIINSGVDTIDTTTKLRSQTNQPKHIVAFCSKTINKPPY
jgi:hypothetical protein